VLTKFYGKLKKNTAFGGASRPFLFACSIYCMAKNFETFSRLVVGELYITPDQKKSYKITMSGDALKLAHQNNSTDSFVINKDGSLTLPISLSSSPSSPASGGAVFVKSDGKLYFINSSGTEYDLTETAEAGDGSGDITGVSAGVGLSGGGVTGDVTVTLDVSELSALGTSPANSDYVVIQDVTDNSTKKVLVSNLIANTGDIQGVTAGTGLGGGGTSGTVTLTLDLASVISSDAANKVLTSDGDGTLTAEANLGFNGSILTVTGDIDLSGDIDVDGTLETDAISIDGTTIAATATELNYVDGVTSAIQTQLNAKHATIDSGNRLSATLVGANGNISNTEFGYLNGIDSNIQAQIETKAPIANPTFTGEIGIGSVNVSETEFGILEGATLSTTELNYLDGADASITSLSLPDNTTISTFGKTIIDDANASTARTTLGLGSVATLSSIDISANTNLAVSTGLDLSGDTLSVDVSDFMASGANNSILTATGTDAFKGNSDLEWDGASLTITKLTETTPAIIVDGGSDTDADVIRVLQDGTQSHGWAIRYLGDNNGDANQFALIMDNQTGTDVNALLVDQDGDATFGADVNVSTHDGSANGFKLGGTLVTATAAELNYIDGVTSAIQTQLDGKLATGGNAATATNATNATNVTTATDSGNATHYLTFADSTAATQQLKTDAGLTYNPNSNNLTLSGDVNVGDDLLVDGFARIDALRVGTTAMTPGDGRLYVEDYGVFVGGLRVGSSADPGANNLSVAGTITLGGTTLTATGTELNYVDGVTSAIQTQMDTKAPIASPTFTGNTIVGDSLMVNTNAVGGGEIIRIKGDADDFNTLVVFGTDTTTEYISLGVKSGVPTITGGYAGTGDAALAFQTSDDSETERMRITAEGDILAGDYSGNSRTWTAVVFGANWDNIGGDYHHVKYRKDGFGNVHFKGVAKATHDNASTSETYPIFTLPAGYRPAMKTLISSAGSYIDSIREPTELRIETSGEVYLADSGDNPEINAWVSIDGVSFTLDSN
jgi:hypothetical protein